MSSFLTLSNLLELRGSSPIEPDEDLILGEHSKIVGTFDSHEIWMSRDFAPMRVFAIVTEEKICRAAIIIDEESIIIDGNEYYLINKIFVRPQDRRKGMGSSIIEFIVLKLGIKLRSGAAVSKSGLALLKRLVDTKSMKFLSYEPSTKGVFEVPNDIFTNLNTSTQLLIKESFLDDKRMFESSLKMARHFFYIDSTFD